jgi:hypothetical protein
MTLKLLRLLSKKKISSQQKVARWLLDVGQVPAGDLEVTLVMDSIVSEEGSGTSFLDISEIEESNSDDSEESHSSSSSSSLTISSISQTDAMEMVAKWVHDMEMIDPEDLLSVVTDSVSESSDSLTHNGSSKATDWEERRTSKTRDTSNKGLRAEEQTIDKVSSCGEKEQLQAATVVETSPLEVDSMNPLTHTASHHEDTEVDSPFVRQSTSLPILAVACQLAVKRCGSFSGIPLYPLQPMVTTNNVKKSVAILPEKPEVVAKNTLNSSGEKEKKKGKKHRVRKTVSSLVKIFLPCCFSKTKTAH